MIVRTYKYFTGVLLLSFSFIVLPNVVLAQQKKDSKITITLSDTTDIIERFSRALYESGFIVDVKDKMFISTKEKKINFAGSMKINVLFTDSTAVMTGLGAIDMKLPYSERVFEPILFMGMEKAFYKLSWRQMEAIGKRFGQLNYSK